VYIYECITVANHSNWDGDEPAAFGKRYCGLTYSSWVARLAGEVPTADDTINSPFVERLQCYSASSVSAWFQKRQQYSLCDRLINNFIIYYSHSISFYIVHFSVYADFIADEFLLISKKKFIRVQKIRLCTCFQWAYLHVCYRAFVPQKLVQICGSQLHIPSSDDYTTRERTLTTLNNWE